jgi:KipI family sensor histidine kinase inhibitor
MEILPYGENGLRLVFGSEITLETHALVRRAYLFLSAAGLTGVTDIIPSFTTCLLIFDSSRTSLEKLAGAVRERQGEMAAAGWGEPRTHEIPVSYGGGYGPDMDTVCAYSGLTEGEVVECHTSAVYTVFALGFLPGFPYLGPLDKKLFVPRLEAPRVKVPEGSVAIAQLQTGIYTFDSPGGWRIIGRTRIRPFDAERPPYSLFAMGDQVRFVSV